MCRAKIAAGVGQNKRKGAKAKKGRICAVCGDKGIDKFRIDKFRGQWVCGHHLTGDLVMDKDQIFEEMLANGSFVGSPAALCSGEHRQDPYKNMNGR
jgi:hypothetical protein